MQRSRFSLPKHVVLTHFILHAFFVGFLVFCRAFGGTDNSHSAERTFNIASYGLGWWDLYAQWGYWLAMLYFTVACMVDLSKSVRARRYRDKFFNLVFPAASTNLVGYWFIVLPITTSAGGPNGYRLAQSWDDFVEHYASTIIVPFFAWVELFMVTHKSWPGWVDGLMVLAFSGGYVVFDLLRWALTQTFAYPYVEDNLPWIFWLIFVGMHLGFFVVGRIVLVSARTIRLKRECCIALLYDSDVDQSEAQPLISDLSRESGATQTRYKDPKHPLAQAVPLLIAVVALIVVNLGFLLNFLLQEREHWISSNSTSISV